MEDRTKRAEFKTLKGNSAVEVKENSAVEK